MEVPANFNLTEGLCLFWGLYMIIAALLILFFSTLRAYFLEFITRPSIRIIAAILCFFVAGFHLYYYQIYKGGEDLVLIMIGCIALLKGLLLVFMPSIFKITERILLSSYISGWLLIIIGFGICLINKALHFITI